MELLLSRLRFEPTHTTGQLYVNGDFFCFTLEDVVREVEGQPVAQWKVQNETAIPQGRYKVTLETSGKFGPDTPTINQVPGFSLIRIHAGNDETNTDGCVLLGYKLSSAGIIQYGTTRPAVLDLKQRIRDVIKTEEVWITIKNIKI